MIREYRVFGITCDHCKTSIQEKLRTVEGVRLVEVDVEHKTVHVAGDVDEAEVRAAISAAGYEVADVI